jgi:hypothetical protein
MSKKRELVITPMAPTRKALKVRALDERALAAVGGGLNGGGGTGGTCTACCDCDC